MHKEIEAHFDITHETLKPSFLQDFLHWLGRFDSGKWRPEKYNTADPVRYPYSLEATNDVIEKWQTDKIGMILKRVSTPKYELDFTGEREKMLVKNELTTYFDSALFRHPRSIENCLGFLNGLYDKLNPVYGYAVHRKDYLAKNLQVTYPQDDEVSSVETWVGRDLSKCLRGVYWANWFGPVYTGFFGEERFKSAPCFRKERLADGGYLILTAAGPMEYQTRAAREAEEGLRQHLGTDAFFDIEAPTRVTRSPWTSRFVR